MFPIKIKEILIIFAIFPFHFGFVCLNNVTALITQPYQLTASPNNVSNSFDISSFENFADEYNIEDISTNDSLNVLNSMNEDYGSNRKLTILVSQQNPFVIYSEKNNSCQPNGLDILILENFALKFDFDIEYLMINETLNEVFSSQKSTEEFFLNFPTS